MKLTLQLLVSCLKGRTIRKVMGWAGSGGEEFSACTNFFFSLTARAGIFFHVNPSARVFFFRQILLFFEQWNLDSLSMFLCFINYSTLTTDQGIQATLMQNLFENVHTVREEEATWSGRLPCPLEFFSHSPSLWCHTPFTNLSCFCRWQ